MKKIFRSLITIALCAPLLSGCAFLDWLEDDGTSQNQTAEKTKLIGLELSDYTNEVGKGEKYTFDGVVTAKYEGGATAEVKYEDCTFSSINTSTVGTKTLKVSYTDKYKENGVEKEVTEKAEAKINVLVLLRDITIYAKNVRPGKSHKVDVLFEPAAASGSELEYSSSDESVLTINQNGEYTGQSEGTAKITVKSKKNPSISKEVNVTVSSTYSDEWTVLVYLCGNNLESAYVTDPEGGCATADLKEIASVANQPNDVNILVQAGGASKWTSTYSNVINVNKRNRFHLNHNNYFSDSQDSKVNMGLSSSFQDFLEWGIGNYPANKVGVILWNHGGAMTGCCGDEQYSDDYLTIAEADAALTAARSSLGYSSSNKFEFIGYDCCLMQVQDIAGLNSKHAKYQLASQESEWGYGWSYDSWIDDLFAKKPTSDILTQAILGFEADTTAAYEAEGATNDQTLSLLDLSYWDAYEDAWESFAQSLASVVNSSSKWNSLKSVANSAQRFGYTEGVYPFDVFDAGHFITRLKADSTFKGNSTLVSRATSVSTCLSNLVAYNWHGSGSANANGLSMFLPVSGYSSQDDYSTSSTPLTNWRSFCIDNGSWYSGWGW